MNTEKYLSAKIISTRGMGGYLAPPKYPMHTHSIETDLNRNPDNRGSMSLEYALTQEYISPKLKGQINELFNEWEKNKLPITDPLVIKWIEDSKRHFGEKSANDYIRKYYPNFK